MPNDNRLSNRSGSNVDVVSFNIGATVPRRCGGPHSVSASIFCVGCAHARARLSRLSWLGFRVSAAFRHAVVGANSTSWDRHENDLAAVLSVGASSRDKSRSVDRIPGTVSVLVEERESARTFDKIPEHISKRRGGHTRSRYLADEDHVRVLLCTLKH